MIRKTNCPCKRIEDHKGKTLHNIQKCHGRLGKQIVRANEKKTIKARRYTTYKKVVLSDVR